MRLISWASSAGRSVLVSRLLGFSPHQQIVILKTGQARCSESTAPRTPRQTNYRPFLHCCFGPSGTGSTFSSARNHTHINPLASSTRLSSIVRIRLPGYGLAISSLQPFTTVAHNPPVILR